jgi:hypothetical protein
MKVKKVHWQLVLLAAGSIECCGCYGGPPIKPTLIGFNVKILAIVLQGSSIWSSIPSKLFNSKQESYSFEIVEHDELLLAMPLLTPFFDFLSAKVKLSLIFSTI